MYYCKGKASGSALFAENDLLFRPTNGNMKKQCGVPFWKRKESVKFDCEIPAKKVPEIGLLFTCQ